MTGEDVPFALAAFFTLGCVAIHGLRRHARALTPPLALAAVSLGLFVGLCALAEKPGTGEAGKQTSAIERSAR